MEFSLYKKKEERRAFFEKRTCCCLGWPQTGKQTQAATAYQKFFTGKSI